MDRKTSLLNTKKWYDYIINKLHMKNKVCARDYYYIELDCEGNKTQCKMKKSEKERTCKLNVRYHIVTVSIHGEGLKKDFNHRNAIGRSMKDLSRMDICHMMSLLIKLWRTTFEVILV